MFSPPQPLRKHRRKYRHTVAKINFFFLKLVMMGIKNTPFYADFKNTNLPKSHNAHKKSYLLPNIFIFGPEGGRLIVFGDFTKIVL
jgi:hypothetical protein